MRSDSEKNRQTTRRAGSNTSTGKPKVVSAQSARIEEQRKKEAAAAKAESTAKGGKSAAEKKSSKAVSNGKVIRRTLGGILLASALFVAAIPSDKSGITKADNPSETGSGPNYDTDISAARNGDVTSDVDSKLDPSNYSDDQKFFSYQITKINNSWVLMWQYQFYIDTINGMTSQAVVCDYNDTYAVEALDLTTNIITGYDYVSEADYNAFVQTCNTTTFKLEESPYSNSAAISELVNKLKRYFSEDYEKWEDEYDAALENWRNEHKDDPGYDPTYIPTFNELSISAFSRTGANMSDETKRIYYCDTHSGLDAGSLSGYTLTPLTNSAQGSAYYTGSFDTQSGSAITGDIPSGDTIYIVTKYESSTNCDENGFKYLGNKMVTAIAKEAFKGTEKVDKITIGGSVAYIGDEAFLDSFLKEVTLQSVTFIGNRVFKDCSYLTTATLNNQTKTIGKEAFKGCKVLKAIKIPTGVTSIGFGAFADCEVLENVDMTENHGCTIGEYAFYNDSKLNSVTFPEDYAISFGTASFALKDGTGGGDSLSEFSFPVKLGSYKSAINDDTYSFSVWDVADESQKNVSSRLGDYILSGRQNLKIVTMPKELGSNDVEFIPDGTFHGCSGLERVYLGVKGTLTTYNSKVKFSKGLFTDVINEDLAVYGPQYVVGSSNPAWPRKSTWVAVSSVCDYVPYIYYDGSTEHYEIGIPPYRYELEVDEDAGTASIVSCEFIDTPSDIDPLVVPSEIAGYDVKALGDGCFKGIKDYIVRLEIEDDSVTEIGDSVFNDCSKLVEADLGNGVVTIGNDAFSDCPLLERIFISEAIESVGNHAFENDPQLEHVYWSAPGDLSRLTNIGTAAFETGSDKLYFHGEIDDAYLPFTYAMNSSNEINDDSVNICYVMSDPYNLYVIHDNVENTNLLIDYPHYKDLPATTKTAFENGSPTTAQLNEINATKYIDIPEAIESVDVVSWLDNNSANTTYNKKNWIYVDDASDEFPDGTVKDRTNVDNAGNKRRDVYGDSSYKDTSDAGCEDGYYAGLFSGYSTESTEVLLEEPGRQFDAVKGNDWIKSVNMPGVKSVPDYCFDSCERLESVIISADCDDLGEHAFQGCTALGSLGTNGNTKYLYDNYVIYEDKGGNLELKECLPSRGIVSGTSKDRWVNTSNDPNLAKVTSIADAAFRDCDGITKADLSDANITKIPQECFYKCDNLTEVLLPDTCMNIQTKAFDEGAKNLEMKLPCDSNISETAFDKDAQEIVIHTYPDCKMTLAYDPAGYDNITVVGDLDTYYWFTFYNEDMTIFEQHKVTSGADDKYPKNEPTPKLAAHNGWAFSSWSPMESSKLDNATEDRQWIAIFEEKTSPLEDNIKQDADALKESADEVAKASPLSANRAETVDAVEDLVSKYNKLVKDFNELSPDSEDYGPIAAAMKALENEMADIVQDYGDIFDINPDGTVKLEADELEKATEAATADIIKELGNLADLAEAVSEATKASAYATATAAAREASNKTNPPATTSPAASASASVSASATASNKASASSAASNSNNPSASASSGYNVIVENGAGTGQYGVGKVVTITAYAPPDGKVFDKWTTSNSDIGFSDPTAVSTTFIMPSHDVKVTATYKSAGAGTTPGSSSNNNASGTPGTGKNSTSNNSASKGNTEVRVTTDTIDNNNKNLASATVAGSTDNFVLKITDSAAAYAEVEQALRNKYGDEFDYVKFVAFDISLYDETGTMKVENTENLAVTITLPIPDEMVSYAGNNKVGVVINGQMEEKTAQFTTIDGVPCIKFTATHFSPYSVFVNTEHMQAGSADDTPKTGDGIAPKWFLSAGMVSMSCVLFLWKDRRPKKKKK
ncbi:MAG: leucine-rich repeat protein [Lachnospiraceae bacterium]|nr:leucine-rich repeat protein [Lachnospiraceae bacterium]